MKLEKISSNQFILADHEEFIGLTKDQVQGIWQNLHLDYVELFLLVGEEVLETQFERDQFRRMVEKAGSVATAMQALETRIVELSAFLKPAQEPRRQAHATVRPVVEAPVEIPVVEPISMEEMPTPYVPFRRPIHSGVPTAPVARRSPTAALRRALGLAVVEAN